MSGGGSRGRDSVVVTGVGWVTPLGDDLEVAWSGLLRGAVALRRLRRLDASGLSADIGGEVDLDDRPCASAGGSRAARLAVAAARRALEDAAIEPAEVGRERIGVVFGSVMTTRPAVEPVAVRLLAGGLPNPAGELQARMGELRTPVAELRAPTAELRGRVGELRGPTAESRTPVAELRTAAMLQASTPALISRAPARELGLAGPNQLVSTACASGNSAIAVAAGLLRARRADAMIAGGADEISYAMLMMFDSFRSLAPDAVRPFDLHRRGLALGEGAAALLLEREADARARRARIYGRLVGHANVADAHHVTAPDPSGAGAARSMAAALRQAGACLADVDYVSAHGTGTPSNDVAEARAIRRAFGAHADRLPVASLKGSIGHAQGAAGAIEAIACLLSLRDGAIPPTANHLTPDPDCALDVVAGSARAGRIRLVLSNAFGFGGNIECVAFAAA